MKNKEVKTGQVEQYNFMKNDEDLGEELSKLVEHRNIMFSMLMGGRVPISQYLAFDKQVSIVISEKEKEYWDKHGLDFLKMETKEIKINVPDGYEIDKKNSTFECIKFKPIAKRWRDDKRADIKGYYIDTDCYLRYFSGKNIESNRLLFATEKQAKSALAMAQISQIIANDERFGGIITDKEWMYEDVVKYCIVRDRSQLAFYSRRCSYDFLAFHTVEQRDLFLKENEDLVKDYLMVD